MTAPAVEPLEPLPEVLSTRYGLSGELLTDFECLCEIRNEIVHPVPLPPGPSDNWPEYLRRVKNSVPPDAGSSVPFRREI